AVQSKDPLEPVVVISEIGENFQHQLAGSVEIRIVAPCNTGRSFKQRNGVLLYNCLPSFVGENSIEQLASGRAIQPRIERHYGAADSEFPRIKCVPEIPCRARIAIWNHHFSQRGTIEDRPLAPMVLKSDLVQHQSLARVGRKMKTPLMPDH